MTVLRHELKQSFKTALIWSVGVSLFTLVAMMVFPRVKEQMRLVNTMIAGMGSLAQAFALDKLDMGTLLGFYAAEAGTMMTLGGGLFAAILGISMLAKEEGRHTAEFLFPHPISRFSVVLQKLIAMLLLMAFYVLVQAAVGILCFRILNEPWDTRDFIEIQLALLLLMAQIGCLCFCISAFLSRESVGLGIGLTIVLYFLHLLLNMEAVPEVVRYFTPFHWTQPSKLVGDGSLSRSLAQLWAGLTAGFIALAFLRYTTKDLRI